MGIESQSGKISLSTDGHILMRVGDTTKKYRVMGKSGQIIDSDTLKKVESILKKAFESNSSELKEVKSLKGTKITKEGVAFSGMEARWEHTEETKVLYAEITSFVQAKIQEQPVANNPDREIHAEKLKKDPLVDRARAKIKSAFKTIGDSFQWVYRKLKGLVERLSEKVKFSYFRFTQRKTGASPDKIRFTYDQRKAGTTPEQINIGYELHKAGASAEQIQKGYDLHSKGASLEQIQIDYTLREAGLSDVRVNDDEESRKVVIDMLEKYYGENSGDKEILISVDNQNVQIFAALERDIGRAQHKFNDKSFRFVPRGTEEKMFKEEFVREMLKVAKTPNAVNLISRIIHQGVIGFTETKIWKSLFDINFLPTKLELTEEDNLESDLEYELYVDGDRVTILAKKLNSIIKSGESDPSYGYQYYTCKITIPLSELKVEDLNVTADQFPGLKTEEYYSDLFLDRATAIQAFKDAQ